jgi:TRAP-type mannitol/chloroaromatic compound transport system permease large subunit
MGALKSACLAEDMLTHGPAVRSSCGGRILVIIVVSFWCHHGTVAGQVAMAMISLPVMIRHGYNMRWPPACWRASGTIIAAGAAVPGVDHHGGPATSVGDMRGGPSPSIPQC